MIRKDQIELALRRLRRSPVPDDLRDRVLRAAAGATEVRASTSRVRPYRSWRFVSIAAGLAILVAAGIWSVRSTPPARRASPPTVKQTQITRAPGDEIVVFWLDDDTPVLVSVAEERARREK